MVTVTFNELFMKRIHPTAGMDVGEETLEITQDEAGVSFDTFYSSNFSNVFLTCLQYDLL